MLQIAVIGVGNMGSRYAELLQDGEIRGAGLAAITRVREPYRSKLQKALDGGLPVYESADALYEAVESGALKLDGVIIATPHYSHEELAVRAFQNGLHVLSDKPSGVYSRQGRQMEEAARAAGKQFAMVFNQRTLPVYRKVKEIVESRKYGDLKRVNWVVTDWYRPEEYYHSSAWRATWKYDGGGVLLNQCPHNLDLLQWICGMPVRVQGFCQEGHFHEIEVEDDVTAYMEWANGATGVFVTSTGDAPGRNRWEISLDNAMLVVENGKLQIGDLQEEMGGSEIQYRKTSRELFRKITGTWNEPELPAPGDAYIQVLQGFADACTGEGKAVAEGSEGRKSLLLSNAIYLSSWDHEMVEVPVPDSEAERAFEKKFEEHLEEKCQK